MPRHALSRTVAIFALAAASVTTPADSTAADARPDALSAQIEAFAHTTGLSYGESKTYFSLNHAVATVQDRAEALFPETFAGLWRTPTDGGLLHIAFTQKAAAALAAVTVAFPRPDLVRVTTTRHSQRELDKAASRLVVDLPVLRGLGAPINTVAVDVVRNSVSVGVLAAPAAVHALLMRRYPTIPIVMESTAPLQQSALECSRQSCLFSLRGGIALYGDGFVCTAGFAATINGTTNRALLTAGHCFSNGSPVEHNGVPMGTVTARVYPGAGDVERIDVTTPILWAPSNLVFWSLTVGSPAVLGVAGRTVSETVGTPVCRTGVTSEDKCGTILARNVTVTYLTGDTISGLTKTSACALNGDSGGPFMSFSDAYGILSGSTVGETCVVNEVSYYTPAGSAESKMGVRINTA